LALTAQPKVRLVRRAAGGDHLAMRSSRGLRRRLAGLFGSIAIVLAASSSPVAGAAGVVLRPVVSGLDAPVFVTSPRDGSGRLFVVEQTGRVRVVKNGVLLATPFIDIRDKLATGGERGLLGLAFHPRYKVNGRFYVYFTRASDGDIAINEYHVSSTNPDVATRAYGRRIITIDHPYSNHNGGRIAFGPDGYLYVGTGDGGSGGDPGNRAQSLASLLGKMLRIDINGTAGTRHYRNPSSNPYVGRYGRNEIWSRGLRNPWGWSFDRVTGDLWIGDVGQNRYEEINRSKVSTGTTSRGRGLNYGWRVMEGRHCYRPASGCNKTGKVVPVVEYPHSQGCSVTGGYVYRGAAVPALAARYVFGDYCTGTIWTIPRNAATPATKSLLMSTGMNISSFGEDQAGELYVLDHGGSLYRFAAS
jgi:glucose/arabinose dehydrogenase